MGVRFFVAKKNAGFKILFMLLISLISNCLCFSSKGYKNYDKRKINGVNYYRKKKKKFNARRSKKSNLVRNTVVTTGVGIGLTYLGKKYFVKDSTIKSNGISEPKLDKREKIDKTQGEVNSIESNMTTGVNIDHIYLEKEYLGKDSIVKSDDIGGPKLNKSEKIDKIQGEVNLNDADKEYIKKNFFFCKWRGNLCWNNTFIQYLMCPDIRCGHYCSSAIMKTINWINEKLAEPDHYLGRVIDAPNNIRPIAVGDDNYLVDGKYHDPSELFYGRFVNDRPVGNKKSSVLLCDLGITSCIVGLGLSGKFVVRSDIYDEHHLEFIRDNMLKGASFGSGERFVFSLDGVKNKSKIFEVSSSGYYPTFISFNDSGSEDYKSCYLIYDDDKKLKYIVYFNTLHNELKVVSLQEIVELMRNSVREYVQYSRSDIVEKYFTSK